MIRICCFSDRGEALARRIGEDLAGEVTRIGGSVRLAPWTEASFAASEALVFVGACGIAVRAVAPHVRSKLTDPAVVVVDETGAFAIPILSGHLGGANDLARRIAGRIGARAVITTATDRNDVFAVDAWARHQDMAVANPERIREVSAALLAGREVSLLTDFSVAGETPRGIRAVSGESGKAGPRVVVSVKRCADEALHLVPRILVLGVGCRRGTSAEALGHALEQVLAESGYERAALCLLASVDLKKDEEGLIRLAEDLGVPFRTYSAKELMETEGSFYSSSFVMRTAGCDNVCERSAVKACGGKLVVERRCFSGITMAIAEKPWTPDWRWRDE